MSESPQSAYLDPKVIERVKRLELIARGAVEGARMGMHKSTLHGLSTEFTHHRPYVQGDAIRHIDWKVYSRTDRYYIKQFEAETNYDAHFLFDASSSMHYGSGDITKLEYAKHLAAAMACMIVNQGDSVGLGIFDGELRDFMPPKGSMSVLGNISEKLYNTEGRPRTNVGGIMEEFAARIRRRGFVILFSDLFDHEAEFIQGLSRLHFAGQHIIVFQIVDHEELSFNFDGIVKFEGLEGEDMIKVHPEKVRLDYIQELEKMIKTYKSSCEAINADYFLIDTMRPVEDVLTEYLTARKRMNWIR
ncbi:MAG: DUF58 domain-containing protein [Lentisphaeria bacterium]|nr:DUF58 domain-containing protein [Lentisphaeria bacterium]NQZ70242.1 DUF58 domain-containing protein [Lentisphaeria bacterium]